MKINLKQAIEYIAIGRTPLPPYKDKEREKCKLTSEEESRAKVLLKEKLANGKLEARGVKGAIEIFDTQGEDQYLKVNLDEQYFVKTYYNNYCDEDPNDSHYMDVLPQHLTLQKKAPDAKTASEKEIEIFLNFPKEERAPTKEKLTPHDAEHYQYDWIRSIVAKQLEFYEVANEEAMLLKTEGYAFVEVDFGELQKAINRSEADFEKEKREESIIKTAHTIEGKGKSINKVAKEIQKKLGKSNKDKGYSIQTISRCIEKMEKSDGSLLFSKDFKRGRTPQKQKNLNENIVKNPNYK